MATVQLLERMARDGRVVAPPAGRSRPTRRSLAGRFGLIALAGCFATVIGVTAAFAQQQPPARGQVQGLVVMTPTGPATCATWIQWRAPGAHPVDKAAVEYWVEGYLSGLAAGSHHDIIGLFQREALAAWLDRYCTANPQTPSSVARPARSP